MRRQRVYLILGVVILAGVLVAVFSRQREPEYGGKRLSEWVQLYANDETSYYEAREAIRYIGTNAIPYLLKRMRYERPSWKTRLYAGVNPRDPSIDRPRTSSEGRDRTSAGGLDQQAVDGVAEVPCR